MNSLRTKLLDMWLQPSLVPATKVCSEVRDGQTLRRSGGNPNRRFDATKECEAPPWRLLHFQLALARCQ